MTLTDADVERWSRQILLPEVGGRGQERLCAARIAVRGAGPATDLATTLLRRAGVGVGEGDLSADVTLALDDAGDAPPAGVVVRGRRRGTRLEVATLVGRPCAACATAPNDAMAAAGSLAAPADVVLGALAAGEALRALLLPSSTGRVHSVDLATGAAGSAVLAPTAGCPRCADRS